MLSVRSKSGKRSESLRKVKTISLKAIAPKQLTCPLVAENEYLPYIHCTICALEWAKYKPEFNQLIQDGQTL